MLSGIGIRRVHSSPAPAGDIAVLRPLRRILRRRLDGWLRRRRDVRAFRALETDLRRLDDRGLRDLGFLRDQIDAVRRRGAAARGP